MDTVPAPIRLVLVMYFTLSGVSDTSKTNIKSPSAASDMDS